MAVLLTKDISFCDTVCQNIVAAEYKQWVLDELETRFDAGVIRKHHTRLDGHSLERIKRHPHIACLRSNGNPYLVFLTRCNMKNVCIFVDKKVQAGYTLPRMVLAAFQFDDALFDGTVLDGEMVRCDANAHVRDAAATAAACSASAQGGATATVAAERHGCPDWVFLINDIYGHMGAALGDTSVVDRQRLVARVLETSFRPSGNDVCSLQQKRFFRVTELRALASDFASGLPYGSRGVLFKPLYRRFPDVLHNFDDSVVKRAPVATAPPPSIPRAGAERASPATCTATCSAAAPADAPSVKVKRAVQQQQQQQQRRPSDGASREDAPLSTAAATPPRVLRVVKGVETDAYKVLDGGVDAGKLYVKDIKQSLWLRSVFANLPLSKYVEMPCVFHPKFQKWQPVET